MRQFDQAKGHDEESKMKDNKLTNKISCDKVQARTINMERDDTKLATPTAEKKYNEKNYTRHFMGRHGRRDRGFHF